VTIWADGFLKRNEIMKTTIAVLALTATFALANSAAQKELERIDRQSAQVQKEYGEKKRALWEKYDKEERKLIDQYEPKLKELREKRRVVERSALEAQGKEIPDRLMSAEENREWIENRARESERKSNQSDSLGSRLKLF